jgi:hypothetical protein
MRAIILAATLLASPAFAQPAFAQKVWTPAPVPNVAPSNNVAPIERAGRATGPDRSAPFSDIPSGATASGGATSSNSGNGVGTPSLSR